MLQDPSILSFVSDNISKKKALLQSTATSSIEAMSAVLTSEANVESATKAVALPTEATSRDFGTQTTQPTLASMPTLTKHTKIKEEEITIFLNDQAFGYKRDVSSCAGTDIYSRCGSAN